MNKLATSDLSRGLHAIWRRWWIVVLAALVGAGFGMATSGTAATSTSHAVVALPTMRSLDMVGVVSDSPAPVDALLAQLQSAATRDRLGDVAKGTALAVVPATDKFSVEIRVTAPDESRSLKATAAYAAELQRLYAENVSVLAQRSIAALAPPISLLQNGVGASTNPAATDAGMRELAKMTLTREVLTRIQSATSAPPTASVMSSTGSSSSGVILLSVAFAVLAAGLLGLLGLSDRYVRYRDDIEPITGESTLLGIIDSPEGDPRVHALLARLGAAATVNLQPVGAPLTDQVARVVTGRADQPTPDVDAPVVLVTQFGHDTIDQLDRAHRAAALGNGPFAGVIAVDPRAVR